MTKTLCVSVFAAEEASHALSGKCRYVSGLENEIKIFLFLELRSAGEMSIVG